jgi:hypothetical protein
MMIYVCIFVMFVQFVQFCSIRIIIYKRTMDQANINSVLITSLVLIDNELAPEQSTHCGK